MSFCCLWQWKILEDHRLHLACCNGWPDYLLNFTHNDCFVFKRSGPQASSCIHGTWYFIIQRLCTKKNGGYEKKPMLRKWWNHFLVMTTCEPHSKKKNLYYDLVCIIKIGDVETSKIQDGSSFYFFYFCNASISYSF